MGIRGSGEGGGDDKQTTSDNRNQMYEFSAWNEGLSDTDWSVMAPSSVYFLPRLIIRVSHMAPGSVTGEVGAPRHFLPVWKRSPEATSLSRGRERGVGGKPYQRRFVLLGACFTSQQYEQCISPTNLHSHLDVLPH